MEQIVCINDTFHPETLKIVKKYNLKLPVKDQVYTIRSVVTTTNGAKGYLLNEIRNNLIPVIEGQVGENAFMFEISFGAFRFRSLDTFDDLEDSLESVDSDKVLETVENVEIQEPCLIP